MAGMASLCGAQAVDGPTQLPHDLPISIQQTTCMAPGGDDEIGSLGGGQEVAIVVRADGIRRRAEGCRMGGAVGKEVDDLERAVAPGAGEGHAAPDGWVVLDGICGAGIEHDEEHPRGRGIPLAPERVTVHARGIQDGAPDRARVLHVVLRSG